MSIVIDKDERIAELEAQVEALEERLRAQNAINKAKGWIMTRLGMTEPEAYSTVKYLATNTSSPLQDAAGSINLLVDAVFKVESHRNKSGYYSQ